MFHVSTMLPFNKDDCQQVRNGFGGYEGKHEALGLKIKHGLSCYSSLITYATRRVPLIALILPGGAKTTHWQRHSQHYLCGRGARGYGTI